MRPTAPSRLVPPVLCLLALQALLAAPALAAPPEPQFTYDHRPTAVVLRYEESSPELADVEPLVLELFGDGHVEVNRPDPYMNPGRHEMRLPAGRMDALLRDILRREVVRVDRRDVEERLKAVETRKRDEARVHGRFPELAAVTEIERTVLVIRLLEYRPDGADGEVLRDVDKTIEWHGLNDQLSRHPHDPELRALHGARAVLRRLLGEPALGGR